MSQQWAVKASPKLPKPFAVLRRMSLFLTATLVHLATLQAQSLPFPQRSLWGVSTYSLGGSGVATFSSLDSFGINPASLAYYRGKSAAGADYQLLPEDMKIWSLTAVDGASSVSTGIQFKWTDFGRSTRHQYQLAAAYPAKWAWVGVGLQTEYFKDLSGGGNGWHITGTAGFIGNLPHGFSVGASIRNYLDREKDSQFPPILRLGASYLYPEKFRATFDAIRTFKLDNQDWNYSTGLEILWEDWLGLSGGYHFNNSGEDSFWGAGLNLRAPKIDVGFAYHQTTESTITRGFSGELTFKF